MTKKMFLVDGSNHAFRVQFALPPMNASDGFPTRALYGFTTLFAKILREHQPDYVVVSFDKGKTFRHEMFADYKGHRPDMPEDLRAQWPHFPELVEAFGYPCRIVPGYEADDVLGTLARQFAGPDLKVWIVTGDKDFCQLVDENIRVLDLMKDEEIGPDGVLEKWGVTPERVVDVLALAGDSSDNIPGVAGVGPKKAAQYVAKYGDVEAVLAHASEIGGKTGEKIAASADIVRLSKQLATICTTAPVAASLLELRPKGPQDEVLRELFEKWEFGQVARKLLPERSALDAATWRAVRTEEELIALDATLRAHGRFAFDLETSHHDDPTIAQVLGVSFSWGAETVYVPLADRFRLGLDARPTVAALLADPTLQKIGHDVKFDLRVARREGLVIEGVAGDALLLDYLLLPNDSAHDLGVLCERYLGHTLKAVGALQTLFVDAVTLEETTRSACERAHAAWELHERLLRRLSEGQLHVYREIELPLVPVLAEMEEKGIAIDPGRIGSVRADIAERVGIALTRCHEALGRPFNVDSTKELQAILFEELQLPAGKKTKTGYSTDASVLEKLEDHALPAAILDYRKLQKLLSTYLDTLPTYIARDGRIHSSFNQAVAATGRLSSNNPNMQNIPVRTFEGRRIRDCFVPAPGHVFLSADYSQVELRILAHLCGDETLVAAFRDRQDIHRRTASEVFGIPLGDVSSEQRNAAKAINFGLIYGMSAFRLAGDLAIPRAEAQRYMEEYFGRLPRVKAWIEASKEEARVAGFVDTLFGRRRRVPNITSKNFQERSAAEREAVNTRVQGTAADIIKIAMIRVQRALTDAGSQARLVLQVHDELLLEVPEDEVEGVRALVAEEMRAAADLAVPLEVNTALGATWNEAHG